MICVLQAGQSGGIQAGMLQGQGGDVQNFQQLLQQNRGAADLVQSQMQGNSGSLNNLSMPNQQGGVAYLNMGGGAIDGSEQVYSASIPPTWRGRTSPFRYSTEPDEPIQRRMVNLQAGDKDGAYPPERQHL